MTVGEGKQRPSQRRRLHGGLGEESDEPEASFAAEEENSSEHYTEAIGEFTDAIGLS